MSNTIYAALYSDKVPDREAWQSAINALGFELELCKDLKVFESSGFSPCLLVGTKTGFELFFDALEDDEELGGSLEGRDRLISFRWGGSLAECACALVASLALVKEYGALVWYDGEAPTGDYEMLKQATEQLYNGVVSEM